MRTTLELGLVLPPLSVQGGDGTCGPAVDLALLRDVAHAAEEVGFGTLWFEEATGPGLVPGGGAGGSAPGPVTVRGGAGAASTDGPTLAAWLSAFVGHLSLGVVVGDGDGRHPSMAARDVTALDHVTDGRAALLLRYPGRSAEAATICRGLLGGHETSYAGRHFHVERAVNRPPPLQPGALTLLAEVGAPGEVDATLVAQVDGVCATVAPDRMAEFSSRFDAAAAAVGGDRLLLWAGELPGSVAEVHDTVQVLHHAGVRGLLCRLPSGGPEALPLLAGWADAIKGWRPR